MINKRAQFFSLYLVALTLFMCGIVIYMYVVGQGNAEAALVSPVEVLEVRDALEVFEMREVELIKSSVAGVEKFGADEFRDEFIDGAVADERMRSFFNGMFVGDVEISGSTGNLFEHKIYSVKDVGGKVVLSRARVEVRDVFVAKREKDDNHFPVGFVFEFEREYVISSDGGVEKR